MKTVNIRCRFPGSWQQSQLHNAVNGGCLYKPGEEESGEESDGESGESEDDESNDNDDDDGSGSDAD